MIAYVGQTRAAGLIAELTAAGLGECTTRGQLPPRRPRWFYDNGAFADYQAGLPFDAVRFTRDMWAIGNGGRGRHRFAPPDFVTLPDRVADWPATVQLSRGFAPDVQRAGVPGYVVVQDGAEAGAVAALLVELGAGGLFVGGSLAWKEATAAAWVKVAHAGGWRCHIGRVGTPDRVQWARRIGADSIDSSFPLWHRDHLAEFLHALGNPAPFTPALFE